MKPSLLALTIALALLASGCEQKEDDVTRTPIVTPHADTTPPSGTYNTAPPTPPTMPADTTPGSPGTHGSPLTPGTSEIPVAPSGTETPGLPSTGTMMEEANRALAQRVRDAFGQDSSVTPQMLSGVTVSADSGRVVLSSTVPDQAARDAVRAVATRIAGADKVVDQMSIQPAVQP